MRKYSLPEPVNRTACPSGRPRMSFSVRGALPPSGRAAVLSKIPPRRPCMRPRCVRQCSQSHAGRALGSIPMCAVDAAGRRWNDAPTMAIPPRHIRLTSHPGQGSSGAPALHWGEADPLERGPVVGTTTHRAQRNVIGTHSGSYGVYRALAVAAGTLERGHRADLTNTAPTDRKSVV